MLYDIIYSTVVLGGFFTFFDILGKINTREIKNLNDLQTDITFKMLYMLKIYSDTSIVVGSFVDRIYTCLKGNQNEEEEYNSEKKIRLDIFSEKENSLINAFIVYKFKDEEDEESESEEEDDEESESEEEDDEESEEEDEEEEEEEEEEEGGEMLYTINNIEKAVLFSNTRTTENCLITAFDYNTKSHITLNSINLETNDQVNNVKMILERIDNSQYDRRLFLNVELENGDEKYDLNKYICSFYRSGNKILSKEFINYLITEKDLCIELKDDYKVILMDKNINMVIINSDQHIDICLKEEKDSLPYLSYNVI